MSQVDSSPDIGRDVTVIGPECFASADERVICWRGRNYTPQRLTLRVRLYNLIVRLRNAR